MKNDLEKDVEAYLVAKVRKLGGRCLKFVSPGNAGVPDRILLFPQGVVIFVETKRPRGSVVASRQKVWHERLRRLGFRTEFIYDKAAVDMFTEGLEIFGTGGQIERF